MMVTMMVTMMIPMMMLEASNTLSSQVADLSILELCLLIAIKHLSQIYEGEPFNFEMVFHEFLKFKRRKMATLPDERGVVSKAWETLVGLRNWKLKVVKIIFLESGEFGAGEAKKWSWKRSSRTICPPCAFPCHLP